MGQTPTPTKPASTSESTQEAPGKEGEPTSESEPELEPVLIPKGGGSPQATTLDGMAATVKQILSENLDIAQWMLEHLRTHLLVPLRLEDLVTLPIPVGDQSQATKMLSQEPAEASPSNRLTPQRLRKSLRRSFCSS